MSTVANKKKTIKEKLFHEFVEYWINVVYLALMFAAFTWYRRFLLASYDITYTEYGVALIEALILAKVVMIGDVLRLGQGLEQKPLIYSTLYKTAVFSLFIGAFVFIENVIKSLWQGTPLTGDIAAFLGKEPSEFLANTVIMFVAFIPFFGVKELGRVLGEDKIRSLFFRRRADA